MRIPITKTQMMIHISSRGICALGSLGLFFSQALPARAAILASTNFESYTAGTNLATGATPLAGPNNAGAVIGDDAVATPFGAGNKFLIMNGNIAQFTV